MDFKRFQEMIQNIDSSQDCPVKRTFPIFQGKWSTAVLFELIRKNPQRFGELQKKIPGITNTMLTSTLRDLEQHGLINRIQYNEIPLRVEYSLTDAGKDIYIILSAMAEWAQKHMK